MNLIVRNASDQHDDTDQGYQIGRDVGRIDQNPIKRCCAARNCAQTQGSDDAKCHEHDGKADGKCANENDAECRLVEMQA